MGVNNSDFEYMAHRRGDTQKDMFYIGAYLGSELNGKLRSLSGKNHITPTSQIPLTTIRTYARTNSPASDGNGGSGYDMWGWYQLIFIQCMYVLKYKNLNSQAAVGMGVVNTSAAIATGGTETKGMDWGDTVNTNQHVKLFGIEDFWGNKRKHLEGILYQSNLHILTATENFNNTGAGYMDKGQSKNTANWGGGGNNSKVEGTTHGGFISISTSGGSTTTYYCDRSCSTGGPTPPQVGGYYADTSNAGIFFLDFWADINRVNVESSSAFFLMYL